MIVRTVLAFAGTIAFALLFGVPRKYFISCGLIGGAGWLLYEVLMAFAGATATEATFFATVLVILLSRLRAVRERCPVTVFLISGIFPLVPGAGIYWTSYYLVTGQMGQAVSSGFVAVKAAIAIVLGIVFVFEIPNKFFRLLDRRKNRAAR
ncbi:MAG: threonine/serine exporter family protein [Aristaeellaceae bacterium]